MAYIRKALADKIQSMEYERDNGWWMYYKPGWIDRNLETHFAHERTKADVIAAADPIPCECRYGGCGTKDVNGLGYR